MVDFLGKEYVIDHVIDDIKQRGEKEAYKLYVSEILRSLNNSIAKNFGGAEYDKSWEEIKKYKPETRTGEEVKEHVLSRIEALKEEYS